MSIIAKSVVSVVAMTLAPVALAQDQRSFPNGTTISLRFEPAGIGGTGTITRRHRGQPTRSVTIDYMAEFTGILSDTQVRYTVMGTTQRGEESIACVATIDWTRARITSYRRIGRGSLTCN